MAVLIGPKGQELHDFVEKVQTECMNHLPENCQYVIVVTRDTDLILGGNITQRDLVGYLGQAMLNVALTQPGKFTHVKMPEKV